MRILKRDLTHYFLRPHNELPQGYLKSCNKFFRELSNKHQATSNKQQATSNKRDKVVHIQKKNYMHDAANRKE